VLDQFVKQTKIEHIFVVEDSYEELLASADPDSWRDPSSMRTKPRRCVTRAGRPGPRIGRLIARTMPTLALPAGNPSVRLVEDAIDDTILRVRPARCNTSPRLRSSSSSGSRQLSGSALASSSSYESSTTKMCSIFVCLTNWSSSGSKLLSTITASIVRVRRDVGEVVRMQAQVQRVQDEAGRHGMPR